MIAGLYARLLPGILTGLIDSHTSPGGLKPFELLLMIRLVLES